MYVYKSIHLFQISAGIVPIHFLMLFTTLLHFKVSTITYPQRTMTRQQSLKPQEIESKSITTSKIRTFTQPRKMSPSQWHQEKDRFLCHEHASTSHVHHNTAHNLGTVFQLMLGTPMSSKPNVSSIDQINLHFWPKSIYFGFMEKGVCISTRHWPTWVRQCVHYFLLEMMQLSGVTLRKRGLFSTNDVMRTTVWCEDIRFYVFLVLLIINANLFLCIKDCDFTKGTPWLSPKMCCLVPSDKI